MGFGAHYSIYTQGSPSGCGWLEIPGVSQVKRGSIIIRRPYLPRRVLLYTVLQDEVRRRFVYFKLVRENVIMIACIYRIFRWALERPPLEACVQQGLHCPFSWPCQVEGSPVASAFLTHTCVGCCSAPYALCRAAARFVCWASGAIGSSFRYFVVRRVLSLLALSIFFFV